MACRPQQLGFDVMNELAFRFISVISKFSYYEPVSPQPTHFRVYKVSGSPNEGIQSCLLVTHRDVNVSPIPHPLCPYLAPPLCPIEQKVESKQNQGCQHGIGYSGVGSLCAKVTLSWPSCGPPASFLCEEPVSPTHPHSSL